MTEANALQKIESLFQDNKKQEALQEYKSIMENAGTRHELWVNYASFLFRCGQYEESIAISQKAISFKPTAEGYHNLACALNMLGRAAEALNAYKAAIHFNYNMTLSHNGIANLYENMGQMTQAIDHHQIATTQDPQNINYWIALALARRKAGRAREALSALRTARQIKPDHSELWTAYGKIFSTLNDYDINKTLIDELTIAIHTPQIRATELTVILQTVFLNQAVIATLMPKIVDYRIADLKTLLLDKSLNWQVLNLDLFVVMLAKIPVLSEAAEKIFTALRYHALEALSEDTTTFPYLREFLPFFAGLGCQSFVNEYVYWETAAERDLITRLGDQIEENIHSTSAFEIAVYACYRPLYKLKNAKMIAQHFQSEIALKTLLRLQITEPLAEEEIKSTLKTYTSIDNEISKLVRDQYEANPYPRWVETSSSGQKNFKGLMHYLFPYLKDEAFAQMNINAPEILIAGCGTGKQSIETALQVQGSHITAIDISAASLGYAIRKTRDYNITNIDYGIADILKIGEMKKQYDVIYCGGVLHHMQDPMAGWRALTDSLKPGGFMMIALYSDIARKSIITARDYIRDKGYTTDIDGIRTCREDIKLMEPHHPIKQVSRWMDFFTTSAFRDLVFHVQEHRFTAPQLKKSIAELGLDFLGFQFSDRAMLRAYTALNPNDPYGLNLDEWDNYERQNPQMFAGMYQFWLRKPG